MAIQELQQVIFKKKAQFKNLESKLFLHETITEDQKFGKWSLQKEQTQNRKKMSGLQKEVLCLREQLKKYESKS